MQTDNYKNSGGKGFSVSQSMMKKWKFLSPKQWHKLYIELNTEDEKDSDSFVFGSLQDSFLFTPTLVSERFFVADTDRLPSDAVKEICDCVFTNLKQRREGYLEIQDEFPESVEIELAIDFDKDLLLQCANNVINDKGERGWNRGWKDETRINKLIEQGKDYFNLLVASEGKKIITTGLNMLAIELKDIIHSDEKVKDYFIQAEGEELIFQLEIFSDYSIYEEEIIDGHRFEKEYKIPVKGALDILRIKHKTKTYQICDFKTAVSAYNFTDNIRKYGYCDQLSFYSYLVKQWIAEERPDLKDYTEEEPINIVIDQQDKIPYLYEYNWSDLDVARYGNRQLLSDLYKTENHNSRIKKGWQEVLEDIAWHYNNHNWSVPRKLIEEGKIKINLQND